MCLQFLRLLKSPSSFLAHAFLTLDSVNSVNSQTTGTVSRISETQDMETPHPHRAVALKSFVGLVFEMGS